jgi:hypothetical protein
MWKTNVCALAVVLCGCGGTSGAGPDGGGSDAAVVGTATITVRHVGAAVSGAHVAFQAVDGSVMGETTTDVNGVASGTVHAGGYITAAWMDAGGNFFLFTYAQVKPGDNLLAKISDAPASSAASLNVTFQDAVAGANQYRASDRCDEGGSATTPSTIVLTANSGCSNGSTWSVLGMARNNTGAGTTLAYATAESLAAAGTATFTTASWASAAAYTLTFTNAPANSVNFGAGLALGVNGVDITADLMGRALAATQGATFNSTIPSSAIADSLAQSYLIDFTPSSGRNMNTLLVQRVIPQPTAGPGPTIDLAAALLPRVHEPGINSTDLNHIVISFQADGAIGAADAAAASMTWMDTAAKGHVWVVAGAAATTLTLPTLPASASAWGPTAINNLTVPNVVVIDLSTAADWDAFRQLFNREAFNLPTSTAATVRISESCVPGVSSRGACLF